MFSGFLGIIIAVLVLGVLVFAHEFGHFLMAKINKIGVDAFSIGFGKELFGFTIGETRYRISMIPFGGYCKMRGDETADTPEGKADPRAMFNRPPSARLAAVLGGPVFNYLFAVAVMTGLLFFGYKDTLITPQVAVIQSETNGTQTPAYLAGIRTQDTILSIGNIPTESFNDIARAVALNIDKEMPLTYIHDNKTNTSKITPRLSKQSGMGYIGVTPLYFSVVGFVQTNSPAYQAKLQAGDEITAIDGKKISYFYEMQDLIQNKANKNVVLTILRSNQTLTINTVLDRFEGKGFLGISPGKLPTHEKNYRAKGILDAVKLGFKESNSFLFETIDGLAAMFKGKIDVQKNISGPVRIIQITGEVATKTDFATLLRFMALISVALGFFNLLPIPGLDGGHVVINFVEMITRKKFPEKIRTYIEYIGLFFIIALSVVVLFNDIFNIWMGR